MAGFQTDEFLKFLVPFVVRLSEMSRHYGGRAERRIILGILRGQYWSHLCFHQAHVVV
jgi:hypothetical protein